jgi:AraC-like DNA-binding protein
MEDKSHIKFNNLLYSCVDQKQRGNEQFVHEHALGYIIAGETHILTNTGVQVIKEGSIGLIRRNQLLKTIKVPPPGGEYKSINIYLTQDHLRRYSIEHQIEPAQNSNAEYNRHLTNDPFLKGYFDSLIPYFTHKQQMSLALADLKTNEAIELLLRADAMLKDFLFDFSEPYKIDLEAYMNRHYMYNVSASHFAKLTGRSLAAFKRDFEKIFKLPPGQWLQQKRLSEAYYLIKQLGRKPSEVYLDVGFENLSHFSFAFKNTYGVAPSMV